MNHPYVVYLTTYHGDSLPPFYIGYTTKAKVFSGYNGSVQSKKYGSIWRQERKDHPELFETEIISHHDTDLDARAREESLHRFYDVPNNPAFINMSIGMANFGGCGENNSKGMLHKTHSEETKRKMRKPKSNHKKRKPTTDAAKKSMSESAKKREHRPHTEVTKQRMREAAKKVKHYPHSEITKQKMSLKKMGNTNCKGRTPWNKGIKS